MNVQFIITALAFAVVSSSQCAVTQKLKNASEKITSIKQDVKIGKINSKCSSCKGGGGGGNGCSRCGKA